MGKAFEKQIKTIEDQGKKQVEVLNTLKSNNQLTIEDKSNNQAIEGESNKQSKAAKVYNNLIDNNE